MYNFLADPDVGAGWEVVAAQWAHAFESPESAVFHVAAVAGSVAVGARGSTAWARVGERLGTVHDVLRNPSLLTGKGPAEINMILGRTPGWRTEALGQGSHQGQGWVLREYLSNGEASGRMLRWHPGGGIHGPDPYWIVTQPNIPTVRLPAGGL
jgi:hypothetical protein